jgi:hypothetical protein
MFDDLERSNREDAPGKAPRVDLARWALFPAMVFFGILLLMFRHHPWRWYIGIGGGYTTFVFWFALGSDAYDFDDVLGDDALFRKIAALLIPHLVCLTFVLAATFEWFHLKPALPHSVTQEGRRGSLWDMVGWWVLALGGLTQGFWMAGKIKRRFTEAEK